MNLPVLTAAKSNRTAVTAFGGLNETNSCGEGEFAAMENLSTDGYPAVETTRPRKLLQTLQRPNGIFQANGLIWADGTELFYNGARVGTVQDSKKQFCAIGARVLIWPDKLALNTETQTLTPLEAEWQATGTVTALPAREDGTAYEGYTEGAAAPEPTEGALWLDTSEKEGVLRRYSTAAERWETVEGVYLQLRAAGIGRQFARYDTVTVTGGGEWEELLAGDHALWQCEENAVTMAAPVKRPGQIGAGEHPLTLRRRVPDMDFLTELDNRVWGCSSRDHTIYACKQGDPTNWYSYLGTAADSFAATVGSEGEFTGAATCLGYALFFKQGLIHKVYGKQPANFQVTTVACRGVQKGCGASLALAGQSLFYKSSEGICRYDGGLPSLVSQKLAGLEDCGEAVAGADFGHYRICVKDAAGQSRWYCYDLTHELWSRETGEDCVGFAANGSRQLCLTAAGALLELDAAAEEPVHWWGELGRIGLRDPKHGIVRRLELAFGAKTRGELKAEASYDGGEEWETLAALKAEPNKKYRLPLLPRRYDTLRLKISGTGEVELFSLAKITQMGSDWQWQA